MKREEPAFYMQFSDYRVYIALAVGLLVVSLLISLAVERSRFGMSLTAIKQNEPAAEAAGIDTLAWKMRAIMLSGAVAAAAGGLYAVVLLVVTPDSVFGVLTSAQALTIALFGGIGILWGPLIGAAILIPLSETLQAQLGDVIPGIQGVRLRHRHHPRGAARAGRRFLARARPVPASMGNARGASDAAGTAHCHGRACAGDAAQTDTGAERDFEIVRWFAGGHERKLRDW